MATGMDIDVIADMIISALVVALWVVPAAWWTYRAAKRGNTKAQYIAQILTAVGCFLATIGFFMELVRVPGILARSRTLSATYLWYRNACTMRNLVAS